MKSIFSLLGTLLTAILALSACTPAAPPSSELRPAIVGEGFDLAARDLKGRFWSSEALQGKVVLITFWASWCGQCTQEMPLLEALQREYAADGLQILTVAIDDDAASVSAFVHAADLSLPVIYDRYGELKQMFAITTLPSTYLIDRNGRQRRILDPATRQWTNFVAGPRAWNNTRTRQFMATLLDESPPATSNPSNH